jgi:branched-chain amino acid transport system substrate-binding protein
MKNISRSLSIAIFYCIVALSTSCNNANTTNIGVLTPLTGENANYGKSAKEGIDLAIEELNNQKYLEKPIRAIYEDDKMEARDGINAINKLIASDRVPVIIGPFGSSVVNAVAPIANQTKTVVISASATADNIKDAGDYVFRITPPNSKQGSDVADFCFNKLRAKTAAILFQTNDYGTSLKSAFESEFKKLGGKVVGAESVNNGDKVFKTQLAKIRSTNPDVIFFPLHIAEAGLVLKQAKELSINSKFISCDGARVNDLFSIAGEAAEGSYYTTPALGYGVSDRAIAEFSTAFENKYGKEPDIFAAYYYEVTKLIASTIREGGYNSDAIKRSLYSITGEKAYKGITGMTSFDQYGETADKSFQVYVATGGKFEIVK